MNNLSESEKIALELLLSGKVAGFSNEENVDLTHAQNWGPQRTISSDFILWLCTDPEMIKDLKAHGIRIRGVRIDGQLNLSAIEIPFSISLCECFIPHPLDLRHASVRSLDLSGSRMVSIDADCLTVLGTMRLAKGFRAEGHVSLIGATIKGDLTCVNGHFDNVSDRKVTTSITGCGDCRERTLHAYSLVLERAKVDGSINLCGGFTAKGGVHLGDATIGVNLNCTKGIFTARTHETIIEGKTSGRRLACEGDAEHHLSCAFNGEGLHVKGNLILNGIEANGEARLTGASIDGDLDSANGKYINEGANAIHGDRLRVHGNIFFCDGFKAKGAVRLPRVEIGADLSFCNGKLKHTKHDLSVLYCEGIQVHGSVYLKSFEANGKVDLSNSTVGGDLNCTDSKFMNKAGTALIADNAEIRGSVYLTSDKLDKFEADGCISLKLVKIGLNLNCENGHFKSDLSYAIEARCMFVGGRVKMKGINAEGGLRIDNSVIRNNLVCSEGKFIAQSTTDKKEDFYAISAGKLQVDGSVYLDDRFSAKGEVVLNDALIGKNLNCDNGTIENMGGYALSAERIKVTGSIFINNGFVSRGGVTLKSAVIGVDLDCSQGNFIIPMKNPEQVVSGQDELEQYALNAANSKIGGSALLKEGFQANGAVSFEDAEIGINLDCSKGEFRNPWNNPEKHTLRQMKADQYALNAKGVKIGRCAFFMDNFLAIGTVSLMSADIGRYLLWTGITNTAEVELDLRSVRAETMRDDQKSWPKENRLHLDGFEYKYLDNPKAIKIKQRVEWLNKQQNFHPQPFEHLAAVLNRCGFEEDAKVVLIEKNKRRSKQPIRWSNRFGKFINRTPGKCEEEQSEPLRLFSWIWHLIIGVLVSYGYRPLRPLLYGLGLVLFGWGFFYLGFSNNIMVPTKDKDNSHIYQIAKSKVSVTNNPDVNASGSIPGDKILKTIEGDHGFYPLVYALDTFLPVIDFQTADYWLPSAHPPPQETFNGLGLALCLYRWILIASGWVITTIFLAALSGLVRR